MKISVARLIVTGMLFLANITYSEARSEEAPVRAVMYEFTYNEETMTITHAQVVGGYPAVEVCRLAMPKVMSAGSVDLAEHERIQLQCAGIMEKASNGDSPI
jgi:hypothetical protein